MSPELDISALQPSDDDRAARRGALVAELAGRAAAGPRVREADGLSRRTLLRGGLAAAGAGACGLAVFGVVPGPGGSSVDVVASARAAAASPEHGILHIVVRFEHGAGIYTSPIYAERRRPGRGFDVIGRPTGRSERWIAEHPARERSVDFVALEGSTRIGRREYSRGPVDTRYRDSWEDVVTVAPMPAREQRRWERARRRAGRRLSGGLDESGDPFVVVRELLDRGRLRPAGTTTLAGRALVRLAGRAPSSVDSGGTTVPPVDYEYLVDAETYVPVRVTSTQVLPARPHAEEPAARRERRLVMRWTFEVFERLPMTPANERLLTVDATGLRVRKPRPWRVPVD